MHLDVLTAGEPNDAACLDSVPEHVPILALQAKADPTGNRESDRRTEDERHLEDGDHVLERHMELGR
ncbi:MAG TPA: hypothetical protein VNP97_05100, partial [Microbacterium sp.]|nr:hypothetical protein [Microbacterium sp.]